jgi:hypothetical protein
MNKSPEANRRDVQRCLARKAAGLSVVRVEIHAERFASALRVRGLADAVDRDALARHASLVLAQWAADHFEFRADGLGPFGTGAERPIRCAR